VHQARHSSTGGLVPKAGGFDICKLKKQQHLAEMGCKRKHAAIPSVNQDHITPTRDEINQENRSPAEFCKLS